MKKKNEKKIVVFFFHSITHCEVEIGMAPVSAYPISTQLRRRVRIHQVHIVPHLATSHIKDISRNVHQCRDGKP